MRAKSPADVRREALALAALDGRPLVPRLVAADPSGDCCGAPASLQTLLPGRPDTAPRNLGRWLDGLAEVTALTAVVEPRGQRVPAEGVTPDRSFVEDLSETFESVADDYLEALDRLPRLHEVLHLVAFVLGDRPDLVLAGLSPDDSVLEVEVS